MKVNVAFEGEHLAETRNEFNEGMAGNKVNSYTAIKNSSKIFTFICTILPLLVFCDSALCQPEKITVFFGNGEKIALFDWSFVYHLTRSDEMLTKGNSPELFKEKSKNLYLMKRYDEVRGKIDFGKGKEISITGDKLASIEYLWNWGYSSSEKVVIILTGGTKIERTRLGPLSTSSFGEEKFIHGKGIFLEGDYTLKGELKHLNYNLDKWLRGAASTGEIIAKIIFQ